MKNLLRIFVMFIFFPVSAVAQDFDRSKIEGFWEYISENEELLSSYPRITLMFNEVKHELDKVHKELVFQFSNETVQPRHLVISADGLEENFAAVEELVSAAPDFKHLTIIAFRPPVKDFMKNDLRLGQAVLKPSELSFLYLTDRGQFDLILIHDDFGALGRKQAVGIAFLILDAAVGEYRVATEIGSIDFVSPGNIPDTFVPLSISRLPEALEYYMQMRTP